MNGRAHTHTQCVLPLSLASTASEKSFTFTRIELSALDVSVCYACVSLRCGCMGYICFSLSFGERVQLNTYGWNSSRLRDSCRVVWRHCFAKSFHWNVCPCFHMEYWISLWVRACDWSRQSFWRFYNAHAMGWLRLACVSIQLHPMETGCLHTSSNVAKIGEGLKRGFAEHIGYFCNSYVTFAIVYDAIDANNGL